MCWKMSFVFFTTTNISAILQLTSSLYLHVTMLNPSDIASPTTDSRCKYKVEVESVMTGRPSVLPCLDLAVRRRGEERPARPARAAVAASCQHTDCIVAWTGLGTGVTLIMLLSCSGQTSMTAGTAQPSQPCDWVYSVLSNVTQRSK